MAVTTLTNLTHVRLANVISPAIADFARGATFLPSLIMQEDLTGQPTLVAKFSSWADVDTVAKVEGTDVTFQGVATAEDGTVTVGELVTPVEIPLLSLEGSQGLIDESAFVRQAGFSLAAKMETDIAALFPSVSASKGSSGQPLSIAAFEDALLALRLAKAPIGGQQNQTVPGAGIASFVGHEKTVSEFARALRQANHAFLSPQEMGLYLDQGNVAAANVRGRWMGIDIFASTYNPTANAGADRVGCLFVQRAFGMATKGGPQVLRQEWAAGTSIRLVTRAPVGFGVTKNAWACKTISAA
jgi:hypothetical protein